MSCSPGFDGGLTQIFILEVGPNNLRRVSSLNGVMIIDLRYFVWQFIGMIFFKMSSDLWPWQPRCGEKHVKGPTKVLFWGSFFSSNFVSIFLLNFVSIWNTIWQTHFQGLCWLVYTRQCPWTYKYKANVLLTILLNINVALIELSSCS